MIHYKLTAGAREKLQLSQKAEIHFGYVYNLKTDPIGTPDVFQYRLVTRKYG